VAVYDARTVVVSPHRGFCVGGLPVDICAVSNVEVYGCHINGEICEECVCTHVSIRLSMLEGSCCVRYGSFCFRIFLIGIAYKTAVSCGENIQLGCLYRRNLKKRLYNCNASIYFNTQCLKKQLTPNYANIKIPNTSPAHKHTQHKIPAIRTRMRYDICIPRNKNLTNKSTTYT